eukprot:CAMPEP_0119107446 /NCGR_PEP_ID=MMETSP1180-20130426/10186_1 /TAXON_ID=3052 ORGANISM="Chlamydomonas cf sp, Strain CCMP681" /NCGR_SAMPLE_ID=MMETSP1180 /ASSEMBLY_ACC=CAM_ASM_000741 /LENGTH=167 /DNA_ID=CAMNT_0007092933 /DNA_START=49 /DNA_END=552 /DNA_ORIENTATION=+
MAPSRLENGVTGSMEWSVHACPSQIRREVGAVFPSLGSADMTHLLIVATCQHSAMDLVQMGDAVDVEKDLLLEQFMAWAKPLCERLMAQGHWADYIDPCSGLPMVHQEGQVVYAEVEALSVLQGFKTSNAGCCKILLHPKWGSAVYPASMFTTAPLEVLMAAVATLP